MKERMLTLVRPQEYAELVALIRAVWHSAYDELLGEEQVEYMTENFQSEAAVRRQSEEESTVYFFLVRDKERIGYCAIRLEEEKLFLSKLYLTQARRGRGLGQEVLREVADMAARLGKKAIYLTVNKANAPAIRAYEKFGFARTQSIQTDIGGGFVMDDYVYEYTL